ncbi:hypothetical protein [Sediminicurvatus halobius]|uniref:Uncharacterized protein n=1 Tax=Sediminicurvatus halobius TaxID=2182432 RepID=A0A2U2MWS1_9GAMM|nr:hypothetical protein [Spiribacter halobius]PWG61300.1 hypothetical protein DEM34_17170 [Spiribacter halobius]UEX78973.1 hypothetical protein LMH63_04845 [Spiribacter halobius]
MTDTDPAAGERERLERLLERLDEGIAQLESAQRFAKHTRSARVLDAIRRLLAMPGGEEALFERIARLDRAGVFAGGDYEHPVRLQPTLCANTLHQGSPADVVLECLNELRLTAVAVGRYAHPNLSAEQARHLLSQILALNLRLLFGQLTEAERVHLGNLAEPVQRHFRFVVEHVGFGDVLEELIREIWRILAQRPIMVTPVKEMITGVAAFLAREDATELGPGQGRGAERLISALFAPTNGCREDPGLAAYAERLEGMDYQALRQEALGFARAMHDTGLVSPYHPVFLRHVVGQNEDLIPTALGLSATGTDGFACYGELVRELIRRAVWPETPQAVFGLAGLLERGVLYDPPVAPALWRQMQLPLCEPARIRLGWLPEDHPGPEATLLEGVLCMLGHPLGVGQGNNPTCQSARALSMWSSNDPDYLLQLVAWAARHDDIVIAFEGKPLHSGPLLAADLPPLLSDVDAVSAVTVPHLDALYEEMGRRCAHREGDFHRWVNPQFHGWWVSHGFAIAVDVPTGKLVDLDDFIRQFHAAYHPLYNGNMPVIHPQPVGLAMTDSAARFIGWHAISLHRVGLDPEGGMRVYFFNPNNDSGQDWGNGVEVAIEGHGERFGEGSLPFEQFVSRLYIFHYDPRESGDPAAVPEDAVARVRDMVVRSWGRGRAPSSGSE